VVEFPWGEGVILIAGLDLGHGDTCWAAGTCRKQCGDQKYLELMPLHMSFLLINMIATEPKGMWWLCPAHAYPVVTSSAVPGEDRSASRGPDCAAPRGSTL
jgi:hypothetical protein